MSKKAQEQFAKGNFEYPVVEGIQASKLVRSWGDFESDNLAINVLGENNKKAVKIFDQAGWK